MELIRQHFPQLTTLQFEQFALLNELYAEWNSKINVISRKDMDAFYERHVLHSLAIALHHDFNNGDTILDLGAGGGFPGIPLAILFPFNRFYLLDSIQKKTKVMQAVVDKLKLHNVQVVNTRAERFYKPYNVVVCRAVAQLIQLDSWIKSTRKSLTELRYLFLKGGDLKDELNVFKNKNRKRIQSLKIISLSDLYSEVFFEQKYLLDIRIHA